MKIQFNPYILTILLSISFSVAAQQTTLKNTFIEAETYFLFEEYADALPLYQKILRENPENYNIHYKVGICYLFNTYRKSQSIKYLESASKNIELNAKTNSFKEQNAPPETMFYLGIAYRKNGYFQKAKSAFISFKSNNNSDDYDFDLVNDEIASCERAVKMVANKIELSLNNDLPLINTKDAEINPLISGNGKTLVFNRELPFYDAVFISRKKMDGSWSAPKNLTEDFGLDGNSYACGISFSGDIIYVYRSDNYDGNIYSSSLRGRNWTTLQKLNSNINTKYWESHASPSADGKILYFTSNRKGGQGGLDIYKAAAMPNGEWGEAINLGPVVNSVYNEEAPFILRDGSTLYFSSQGHGTIGGYDIFKCQATTQGDWTKPQNLGYPINTGDDEMHYCPEADGAYGLMSLFDPGTSVGMKDIYLISYISEMLNKSVNVQLPITAESLIRNKLNNLTLSVTDANSGQVVYQTKVKKQDTYAFRVPEGTYEIQIKGKGVQSYSQIATVSSSSGDAVTLSNVFLKADTLQTDRLTPLKIDFIKAKKKNVFVSSGEALTLIIDVNKGMKLSVSTFNNDSLQNIEKFKTQRNSVEYSFTPLPGENLVVFESITKQGEVLKETVRVTYVPDSLQGNSANTEEASQSKELLRQCNFLPQNMLDEFDIKMIDSYSVTALFGYLSGKTELDDSLTLNQIDLLTAVLLTQKKNNEIKSDISNSKLPQELSENDFHKYPIFNFIDFRSDLNEKEKVEFDLSLTSEIMSNGNSLLPPLQYLSSFYFGEDTPSITAENYKQQLLNDQNGNSTSLCYTTQNLKDFQYKLLSYKNEQINLLVLQYLSKEKPANNSIELMLYMLNNCESVGLEKEDLVRELDFINETEKDYLEKFINAIAEESTGELKETIIENKDDLIASSSYYNAYFSIIQSSSANEIDELTSLLLKQANCWHADSLKMFLEQTQNVEMLNAANASEYDFSNASELVKHLLAGAGTYNYTVNDVYEVILVKNLNYTSGFGITSKSAQAGKNQSSSNKPILYTILVIAILSLSLIIIKKRKKEK